ncbi:MAG: C40 family peptidase [Bacteroidales bacterium]|nr:C40 family peptidase [Bacteroidales bacterium]
MGKTIESACDWAVSVANDNSHGYSQIDRWGPDYDCSSLVISAYEQAGIKVKEAGATFTGNMRQVFKKCGFQDIKYSKNMALKRGDILLNEIHHTCLYLGENKIVQASCSETGGTTGKPGDQTGREIATGKFYEYSKGWDYVLRYDEDDQEVQTVEITMTVLNPGAQGSEVTLLQVLLNELGFKGSNGKALSVDGWYKPGGNTEYALVLAQKSFGLTSDKICGKKTWTCLLHSRYS